MFGLDKMLAGIGDRREKAQFPTKAVVVPAFWMQLCRFGSLNALEQTRGGALWRRVADSPLPSADTMGYVYERVECDDFRRALIDFYKKLRRNKALGLVAGFKGATVDGHELTASYKRCCEKCSVRMVRAGDEYKPQYYHRIVALQLLGPRFQLLLDFELQLPGEDEVAAAVRLIRRVIKNAPRAFSVVMFDSLYARAPVVKLLRQRHKDIIVVLKDERRELLQDARGLCQLERPKEFTKGRTRYQQWDIEGFRSWGQVGRPMRVVRSLETTTKRERVGNKWKITVEIHDWTWTTTLSREEASTEAIVALGHARWRIENQGFNELCTFWHLDHVFKHQANAILGFLLTLALAFDVFHAFWARNLKPQLREPHTKIHWAKLIEATFRVLLAPKRFLQPP